MIDHKKITLKGIANFLSYPAFALSIFSLLYSFILPDFKSRDTAFCYAYDAMIITFRCKIDFVGTILNFSHPFLGWILGMLFFPYLPIIILINFLALIGLINVFKLVKSLAA